MGKYKLSKLSKEQKAVLKVFEDFRIEINPKYINDQYMRYYNDGVRHIDIPNKPYHVTVEYLFDRIVALLQPNN